MNLIVVFLQKAIAQGIAILYGANGEIVTEKSGNLNLGVPGMMYMGGVAGLMGAFLYENSVEAPRALCGHADRAGMRAGVLRPGGADLQRAHHLPSGQPERDRSCADHLWHGLWQLLRRFAVQAGGRRGADFHTGYGQRLPGQDSGTQHAAVVGEVLFSYGFLTYFSIVLTVVLSWFLYRTRKGLNLRAVGENAATADAAA